MPLQTKDFATLVSEQIAVVQGSSNKLVDTTIGSILRAVLEAYSAVALWLQGLILQVLAMSRAATSSGTDLDSWMADYGVTRIAAANATGLVTFSRFTATAAATIPVGALVQTADGKQQYAVTLDLTNTYYSTTASAYVLGAGVASGALPVKAVTAGKAANAVAGAINTMGQALPGIDTVSNAAAFINGANIESDTALRVRFISYLASLSKATKAAVLYAATSANPAVTATVIENVDYSGATRLGYFSVIVDDGTGAPSAALLAAVSSAVEAVRPLTVTYGVFPATAVTVNVTLSVIVANGYDQTSTLAQVTTYVTAALNALGLGNSLPITRVEQLAYAATPAIVNVVSATLNGLASDVSITNKQIIKPGTVSVSVATAGDTTAGSNVFTGTPRIFDGGTFV